VILEILGPVAVGVLSGYYLRSWEVVAKAAQKKNEKSELPKDVYSYASCTVYKPLFGENQKATHLGVECPRCMGGWAVSTQIERYKLKNCECEACPWPHFHWECGTCGYAFYILGKDVKP
jgi:hypothetical protein